MAAFGLKPNGAGAQDRHLECSLKYTCNGIIGNTFPLHTHCAAVLRINVKALTAVKGVGETTAIMLKSVAGAAGRLARDGIMDRGGARQLGGADGLSQN